MLLDRFQNAVTHVDKEVRPLMFLQVVRLASLFQPAMSALNWTSTLWDGYFRGCLKAIEDFNTLVARSDWSHFYVNWLLILTYLKSLGFTTSTTTRFKGHLQNWKT